MSKLLLNYRGVPDDEIEQVRELMKAHDIDVYETPPSRWAVSAGGLWISDDSRYEQARTVLDEYEQHRAVTARLQYQQRLREGKALTLLDRIREDPLRFVLYAAAVGMILYFMIMPFFDIGK